MTTLKYVPFSYIKMFLWICLLRKISKLLFINFMYCKFFFNFCRLKTFKWIRNCWKFDRQPIGETNSKKFTITLNIHKYICMYICMHITLIIKNNNTLSQKISSILFSMKRGLRIRRQKRYFSSWVYIIMNIDYSDGQYLNVILYVYSIMVRYWVLEI